MVNYAFALALVTAAVSRAGIFSLTLGLALLTGAVALAGLINPGRENPISGRVACVLATLLAFTPLMAPPLQAWRLEKLAIKRAAETKPIYQVLDQQTAALGPLLVQYAAATGYLPEYQGAEMLPRVNASGVLEPSRPAPGITVPRDPFHPQNAPLRWAAIPGAGVLLVSVGQDGVTELALPGPPIDAKPHPLAGFAGTGQDPRLAIYDPTNGSLGLGDPVRFVAATSSLEDVFAPLYKAWDLAAARSPIIPPPKKASSSGGFGRAAMLRQILESEKPAPTDGPNPQSGQDGTAAEVLLAERSYLAALALASRARNLRHPYPAQWQQGDFAIDRTRGIALYHLGAFREGADALNLHLVEEPNDVLAHFYAAACLHYGGLTDHARLHAAAAAQIDPLSPIGTPAMTVFQELTRGTPPSFPPPEALPASGP
jgi:hypothetical protein